MMYRNGEFKDCTGYDQTLHLPQVLGPNAVHCSAKIYSNFFFMDKI